MNIVKSKSFKNGTGDVFHRAAKLHANEIRVAVNAETFAAVQQLLEIIGKGLVLSLIHIW